MGLSAQLRSCASRGGEAVCRDGSVGLAGAEGAGGSCEVDGCGLCRAEAERGQEGGAGGEGGEAGRAEHKLIS